MRLPRPNGLDGLCIRSGAEHFNARSRRGRKPIERRKACGACVWSPFGLITRVVKVSLLLFVSRGAPLVEARQVPAATPSNAPTPVLNVAAKPVPSANRPAMSPTLSQPTLPQTNPTTSTPTSSLATTTASPTYALNEQTVYPLQIILSGNFANSNNNATELGNITVQNVWEEAMNTHISNFYLSNSFVFNISVETKILRYGNQSLALSCCAGINALNGVGNVTNTPSPATAATATATATFHTMNSTALPFSTDTSILIYAQEVKYRTTDLSITADTILSSPFANTASQQTFITNLHNLARNITTFFDSVTSISTVTLLNSAIVPKYKAQNHQLQMTLFPQSPMNTDALIIWEQTMENFIQSYWLNAFFDGSSDGTGVIEILSVQSFVELQQPPYVGKSNTSGTSTVSATTTIAASLPSNLNSTAYGGSNRFRGRQRHLQHFLSGSSNTTTSASLSPSISPPSAPTSQRPTSQSQGTKVTITYTEVITYTSFNSVKNPVSLSMAPFESQDGQSAFVLSLRSSGNPAFANLVSVSSVLSSTPSPVSPTIAPSTAPSISAMPSSPPLIPPTVTKKSVAQVVAPVVIVLVFAGLLGVFYIRKLKNRHRGDGRSAVACLKNSSCNCRRCNAASSGDSHVPNVVSTGDPIGEMEEQKRVRKSGGKRRRSDALVKHNGENGCSRGDSSTDDDYERMRSEVRRRREADTVESVDGDDGDTSVVAVAAAPVPDTQAHHRVNVSKDSTSWSEGRCEHRPTTQLLEESARVSPLALPQLRPLPQQQQQHHQQLQQQPSLPVERTAVIQQETADGGIMTVSPIDDTVFMTVFPIDDYDVGSNNDISKAASNRP